MFTYNNIKDMIRNGYILDEMYFITDEGFIFVTDVFDNKNDFIICGIKGENIEEYEDEEDGEYYIHHILLEDMNNMNFIHYVPTPNDIITKKYTWDYAVDNDKYFTLDDAREQRNYWKYEAEKECYPYLTL